LSLKADGFRATFGYHKNVSDKLILVQELKFTLALLNVPQKMQDISTTTTFYDQVIYSDMQLNTSGISQYIDEGYQGDAAADFRKKHYLVVI
jgi:hypothetical protein